MVILVFGLAAVAVVATSLIWWVYLSDERRRAFERGRQEGRLELVGSLRPLTESLHRLSILLLRRVDSEQHQRLDQVLRRWVRTVDQAVTRGDDEMINDIISAGLSIEAEADRLRISEQNAGQAGGDSLNRRTEADVQQPEEGSNSPVGRLTAIRPPNDSNEERGN